MSDRSDDSDSGSGSGSSCDSQDAAYRCRYQFTSALTRMVASRLVLDAQRRGVRISRTFSLIKFITKKSQYVYIIF